MLINIIESFKGGLLNICIYTCSMYTMYTLVIQLHLYMLLAIFFLIKDFE